ncbi:MAG: WYL domain-containing protein [Prevotella sp.]|nr:WYL domain-containing protein [Prevotella sp.]
MQNENFNQGFKYYRVLKIYGKLMSGEVINKSEEAKLFGVTERTFQRDIEDLRCFFADDAGENGARKELVYSRELNGYHLVDEDAAALNVSELTAVCKILLESRAFAGEEMLPLVNKLLCRCAHVKNRQEISGIVSEDMNRYSGTPCGKRLISLVGDISKAVAERKYMKIVYLKQDGFETERLIKPVRISFREFYFYLSALSGGSENGGMFISDYRVDRIQSFEVLDRYFSAP